MIQTLAHQGLLYPLLTYIVAPSLSVVTTWQWVWSRGVCWRLGRVLQTTLCLSSAICSTRHTPYLTTQEDQAVTDLVSWWWKLRKISFKLGSLVFELASHHFAMSGRVDWLYHIRWNSHVTSRSEQGTMRLRFGDTSKAITLLTTAYIGAVGCAC